MIAPIHGQIYPQPAFILDAYNDWVNSPPKYRGAALCIHERKHKTDGRASCGGHGVTLALEVADIEPLREQIENAGMGPTAIREHPWNARVFYFFDPEGHRIEIWQTREDTPMH